MEISLKYVAQYMDLVDYKKWEEAHRAKLKAEKFISKRIHGYEWEVSQKIGEWAGENMMRWFKAVKKYGPHEAEKVWQEVKTKGKPPAYLWRILHPK